MNKVEVYNRILSEKPTSNRIKEFVTLWKGEKNPESFLININGEQKELCNDEAMFRMDFQAIRKEEELLEVKFDLLKKQSKDILDESVTIEIVHLLDSIYSTQLKYPTIFARELHKLIQSGLLEEIQSSRENQCFQHEAECVDCIARINEREEVSKWNLNNAYSFATKFCNRINPNRFPIYDSYVDSLLWYYRYSIESMEFKRKELKDYRKFIKIYNKYREAWNLDSDLDYKQIDVFMWTYGKAIKKLQESKKSQKLKDLQELNMSPSDKYVRIEPNEVLEKYIKNKY